MKGKYDELFLKAEVTVIGGGAAGHEPPPWLPPNPGSG
jgi:hypothetical protein